MGSSVIGDTSFFSGFWLPADREKFLDYLFSGNSV